MKRTQIQIAIDALKKQLDKYHDQCQKAIAARADADNSVKFFDKEIADLEKKIQSLEGTNAAGQ